MSVNEEEPSLPEDGDKGQEIDLGRLSSEEMKDAFSLGKKDTKTVPAEKPTFATQTNVEQATEVKTRGRNIRRAFGGFSFWKRRKKEQAEKAKELSFGIDLSPPSGEAIDPPSAFQELLQPLSESELILLQKDVQADESVYVRINRARESAGTKQSWAIFITSIFALLCAVALAPGYLTETLPSAGNEWLPAALGQDARGAIVFALGLLLPVFSFMILSEGVRLLLVGVIETAPANTVRGIVTISLALLSLLFLLLGNILLGMTTLLLWWLIKKATEHPLFRKIRSKREER